MISSSMFVYKVIMICLY